jgi:hypothetical protein
VGSNDGDAAQQRHAQWRRERAASVTSPQGNLAHVETRW